jgi:carbon storage regulator
MSKNHEGATVLLLTRRPVESLKIGEDVTITILALKNNQVRVGIEAPKNIAVYREEIYDRIKREAQRQREEPLVSL